MSAFLHAVAFVYGPALVAAFALVVVLAWRARR